MLQIILTIVSAALLGFIVYFAFSPRSSKILKRAAIIALVLTTLSLAVCAFLLLSEPAASPGQVFVETTEQPPPVKKTSAAPVFIVLSLLLLFMFFIAFLAIREEKRKKGPGEPGNAKDAGHHIINFRNREWGVGSRE
jgi:drug/metabolite transporter (DMT)-like permease